MTYVATAEVSDQLESAQRGSANFIDRMSHDAPGSTLDHRLSLLTGFILTYGMMVARGHFVCLPSHLIGYLLSMTFVAQILRFSFFLGWMLKSLIKRFSGQDTYRKMTPMF